MAGYAGGSVLLGNEVMPGLDAAGSDVVGHPNYQQCSQQDDP